MKPRLHACMQAALLGLLLLAFSTEASAACPGNFGTEVAGSRSTEIGASGTYSRVALSAAPSRTSRVTGPLSRSYACPSSAAPWLDYWIVLYPPTPGDPPTCEGAVLPPTSSGAWVLPDGGEVLLCARRPDPWPLLAPAVLAVEVEVSQNHTGLSVPVVLEVRR